MSDRDLKCVHCYEDQSNYRNRVDAVFMFDGLSLCADHYHEHRDVVVSDSLIPVPRPLYGQEYLGPKIPSPKTIINIPYRDGYQPSQ